jgi:hypothetical protein
LFLCWSIFDFDDRVRAATSDLLGLGQDVILNVASLVSAVGNGNIGMVEPLSCVTQWLARSRVLVGAVMVHYM